MNNNVVIQSRIIPLLIKDAPVIGQKIYLPDDQYLRSNEIYQIRSHSPDFLPFVVGDIGANYDLGENLNNVQITDLVRFGLYMVDQKGNVRLRNYPLTGLLRSTNISIVATSPNAKKDRIFALNEISPETSYITWWGGGAFITALPAVLLMTFFFRQVRPIITTYPYGDQSRRKNI